MARDPVKISKDLNDNAVSNPVYTLPSDGTDVLAINADGSINTSVSATDLDIRDLTHVSDSVKVGDGTDFLAVNADGSINSVVTATDLDIRDISVTQDSILIYANTAKDGSGTDYVPLVDADGHLQVDILSGSSSGTEYTEDAIAPAAATAPAVLVERDDALSTITPAEGDWTKLYANERGALWVELDPTNPVSIDDNGSSITVDGTVAATQSGTWNINTVTSITNDVNIADGGNSITVDDGGLTLSIDDGGSSITVDGSVTVTATDLDIRDLSASQDNVAISDGTDTLDVNADGSINAVVTATDLDIRDLTHATDSVKVGDGTDFLAVNSDGSINVVHQSATGTAIANYSQAASLASSASSNHDYTASGGSFEPIRVEVSGESIGTFEILANAVTIGLVRTSVENPNAVFNFPDGFSVADTQVVRVTRTNDSNKAHDFDSTIIGYQN
jgi:hypothetical protein